MKVSKNVPFAVLLVSLFSTVIVSVGDVHVEVNLQVLPEINRLDK